MTLIGPSIDTPLATIECTRKDLVEVRFKPGIVLSLDGITALLDARERMGGEAPRLVLIVFPPEDVDFHMEMIIKDNYEGRPVQQHSKAVAWVVRSAHNERFTRLYFNYFPSPVPAAIFLEEAEARTWLEQFA